MKSFFCRRGVLRSLVLSLAIGALGVSAGAMAANKTSGGIYGEAQAGATVTAQNPDTGLTRTVAADNSGYFNFAALPPGTYKVQEMQNGNVVGTQTVLVSINHSSHVSFMGAAQQLGTIQVTGGAVNPIDVTTSNSSLVLNSQQFKQLPVARDTNAVTLLAPSVIPSAPTLNIETTSFGGSSAAENAYYLNGLNITDNLNFVSYSHPPFEALQEYQVLTGGLTAAYGGALGGILNLVTKSGTNTYHAGASIYWIPRGLHATSPDTVVRVPGSTDLQYYDRNSDNSHDNLTYNLYASGPVVKDHVFFYAMYQGNDSNDNYYSTAQLTNEQSSSPQGLIKLDWQINDANLLEVTAYDSQHDITDYTSDLVHPNTTWDDNARIETDYNRGGKAYIGKYTWVPTSNFNVSAMWGYVTFDHGENSPTRDCPRVTDARTGVGIHKGCWTNILYAGANDFDSRHESRIDGEWQLGTHDITFGYDRQAFFASSHNDYSGGAGWFYLPIPDDGVTGIGDIPIPASVQAQGSYARMRVYRNGAEFTNLQSAIYLQDNWRIGNFYFRYGARTISYTNYNPVGDAYIDIKNKIAPRLGLSWDVFGDSSLKLYASAGRYYIPPSGDSNVRLSGQAWDYYEFYSYTGMNSTTGVPTGLTPFGHRVYENGDNGDLPDAASVVAKNLDPMYEDEFILGAQKRIEGTQWSLGLKGIRRNLKAGMDDVCGFAISYGNVHQWVVKNQGQAAADNLPGCFLMNPGASATTVAPDGKEYTIPADVIGMPKAVRYYSAIEFLFDRAFDGTWFLHGSLTWSHLYGNEEGYTLSSIGQVDSGLTESFDFPGLAEGAYGDLANDRTWVFKVFGAYQIAPEWRVGMNIRYQSGQPLSCLGLYAGPIPNAIATLYGGDSHYCGGKLVPQGSVGRGPRVYDVDGSIHYMPSWAPGLNIGLTVVNLFNFHNAEQLLVAGENGDGVPLPQYLAVYGYQQPQYFRFSVEYDFF
ncbi:MAG TPA: TonB-dependent receptor [Gammaproteobacteria bacterium]|nr:TonB-dependent receptor [Gammaproteobacteria bacterium]